MPIIEFSAYLVVEFGLAQLFVTSLVRLNQTICTDCLTNFIYDVLGGHHGHFAEVSFRWNYEAQSAPTLFILHEGRVVYFGQMVFRSADSNADDQGNQDTSDFEDEDFYELKVVSAVTDQIILRKRFLIWSQLEGNFAN